MQRFAFLAVYGYADGSELYIPMNSRLQPLQKPLDELGLALWLLLEHMPTATLEEWTNLRGIVPNLVVLLMYQHAQKIAPQSTKLYWQTAACKVWQSMSSVQRMRAGRALAQVAP
jgi:hypothetical protein